MILLIPHQGAEGGMRLAEALTDGREAEVVFTAAESSASLALAPHRTQLSGPPRPSVTTQLSDAQ